MKREDFLKTFPGLAKTYKPSPEVLKHIANLTLCMIVGPSGVGKSTLIERSGLNFVPSDTTREARPGEKDGTDLYFRTDYDEVLAEMRAGRFVQVAIGSGGDFYATKASSYLGSGVAIIPVVSDVAPIFRGLGFAKTITAFVTPPTFEEWMHRMSIHPATDEQRAKRLAEARRSFEFGLRDEQTHFILNDELETAERQLKNLVAGSIDSERENTARAIAKSLLGRLV